ncbi:hypothetical protein [Pararobbsia alpina]|uniref:hypothetical protein n=1 Tax=Pararobbsia alpina TaxID=621374 RepID=UPI0039A4DEB4
MLNKLIVSSLENGMKISGTTPQHIGHLHCAATSSTAQVSTVRECAPGLLQFAIKMARATTNLVKCGLRADAP